MLLGEKSLIQRGDFMRNIKQIAYNHSPRGNEKIKYIVIHDTGNSAAGANAQAHFNYFNGGDRSSSADFFVDSTQVLCINDYYKYYTWHCGDGHGKYGITNRNSIGIEICINSDGNQDMAITKTISLVKELMKELNIPIERVVRHYDASRKNCPASMSKNNWAKWYEFKQKLQTEGLTVSQYEELKSMIVKLTNDINELKNPMIYAWIDDNMPDWAKPTISKLYDKGYLKGDEEGKLNLDMNMLRILVILDRSGAFDN